MNIKSFINIKKTILAMALFIGLLITAQPKDLKIRYYDGNNSSYGLDISVLDAVFENVYVNGSTTASTADIATTSQNFSNLPTTATGFADAQMVIVRGYADNTSPRITQAQADAMVGFVKAGGILITNFRGIWIGTTVDANKYMAEQLFSPTRTIGTAGVSPVNLIGNPAPQINYVAYAANPGVGPLALNSGATTVNHTTLTTGYNNLPIESIIFGQQNATVGNCLENYALDFVVPSFPGSANALNAGTRGFALLSGEAFGPLSTGIFSIGGAPTATRNNSAANQNVAGLLYDFLYNPSAMATRRAWTTNPSNVNTSCPPTTSSVECPAGTQTAPTVSSPTAANCPNSSVNLNSLVTSATPTGTQLVWYTTNNHSNTAVSNPTAVTTSGTYYAFYQGTATGFTNCFSPASSPITVTITSPCPCNVGTAVPVIN